MAFYSQSRAVFHKLFIVAKRNLEITVWFVFQDFKIAPMVALINTRPGGYFTTCSYG